MYIYICMYVYTHTYIYIYLGLEGGDWTASKHGPSEGFKMIFYGISLGFDRDSMDFFYVYMTSMNQFWPTIWLDLCTFQHANIGI